MSATGYWILRYQQQLYAFRDAEANPAFPFGSAQEIGIHGEALHIGDWQGHPCYAVELTSADILPTLEPTPLRSLHASVGMEGFMLAGRGFQLLDWQRHHRYCGRCATPTLKVDHEFAMRCPKCGLLAYPRISPAIMVLIHRGNELLLARSPRFAPGIYSALAGFVEPGETLEQAVHREVREEVGVEVRNLRYFRSQPWPFPDSLMIAFTAEYASGELTPDPQELEDAGWFPVDQLPSLPAPVSLARHLIDATCAELRAETEQRHDL